MYKLFPLIIVGLLLGAMVGCSGSTGPVEPAKDIPSGQSADTHQLWGLWQFTADPARGTLDVVPLRTGEMHINALPFLEPPVLVNVTLESLKFDGNIVEADIGIRHPFLGLSEFTGFDVCGVLITNGSVSGFEDTDLVMAGEGDTRLLNPDGWTRWWNPAQFPIGNTMFNYKEGLLGTPDSTADYNCTLNGYKLFCDELTDPNAPIGDVDMTSRCVFSAGQKNIRHYTIELGSAGLIFNYAVDASWQFPDGPPPWTIPDDFGPNANRVEAWNMSITEIDNTLWNDGTNNGGDLSLLIDVWDHYNAGLNTVKVESGGNFDAASSSAPIDGGEGYSTYQIDITDATPAAGSIELFITIASEAVGYQDLLPAKPVAAYFKHSVTVYNESPVPPCGTGNFGKPTQTPFMDYNYLSVVKFEVAWLVSGPYAGEMIVGGGQIGSVGTIRRYNMDTVGSHSGSLFITLPDGSLGPFWGCLYHMEVEPKTGRVIVVPDGLGVNNSMLIYDDQGNLLSPSSGISVGSNRKIVAMDANKNGDLWLLTGNYISWPTGSDMRLERWAYQTGSPYYANDPASDLNVDEYISNYDEKSGLYYYNNNVYDLAIMYPEQRMFVFQGAWSAENNGILTVFDLNAGEPPTYRDDLSDDSLLSSPCWLAGNDYLKATEGAIWCDHSDSKLDGCRVVVYARTANISPFYFKATLARLDRDGKVLNEVEYNYNGAYTMGVNEDSDPAKNYLVFAGYGPTECYMSEPPADW